MNETGRRELLHIKKYPNRRYYDTTRSRHVTLQEVYDLVREGHDVKITDSRNGDDITNLVLLQVVLEKDQPKLDLFPTAVFHLMLRTDRQVLRSSLDRFFGPFSKMIAASQQQFDTYLRQALQANMVSPLEWANTMMQAFSPFPQAGRNGHMDSSEAATDDAADVQENVAPRGEESLDELRRQAAALTQRIDELSSGRSDR